MSLPTPYTSTTIDWLTTFPASPHRLLLQPRSRGPDLQTPEGGPRPFGWLVSTTIRHWARIHGYGNINPLSIDYACRPRLRSRLTLGGLTLPRNPWSFGGEFHLSFATHACILTLTVASTAGSPAASTDAGRSPTHHTPLDNPCRKKPMYCVSAAASAVSHLSPVTLSAQDHLTSELLRTLSGWLLLS